MYVYIYIYIYTYMYRETAGGDDWNEIVSQLVNDNFLILFYRLLSSPFEQNRS